MIKNMLCPCSDFSSADSKILSVDTYKISKSQQHIYYISFIHNFYFSDFTFLDLLINLMKLMLFYIFYCPLTLPYECKDLLIHSHPTQIGLSQPVLLPHPHPSGKLSPFTELENQSEMQLSHSNFAMNEKSDDVRKKRKRNGVLKSCFISAVKNFI
jgi:hypothetical protein